VRFESIFDNPVDNCSNKESSRSSSKHRRQLADRCVHIVRKIKQSWTRKRKENSLQMIYDQLGNNIIAFTTYLKYQFSCTSKAVGFSISVQES